MKVTLISHSQLSKEFKQSLPLEVPTDGQAIALTCIRTCYSHNKPSEIVSIEGEKYFGRKATDGERGTEADRLIRYIVRSGHTSTLESLNYSFAIEGVSRALLAQLTRHRMFSFSVQSQRYVKFSSDSKSGGFDYVVPDKIYNKSEEAIELYEETMEYLQEAYNDLIKLGIPQEDARSILPQSATCNLVLTVNLRALLDFYAKRRAGKGAQQEITVLAEELKSKVVGVESWTEAFFGGGN
ncbi:FAD-dependent thymidylate synthase [Bacillus cereus]|nr:FAD-dependent thymidylate synthase [Bacillus cereus]